VVRSIDDDPELEQFVLILISGELVRSLTIVEAVEFRSNMSLTNASAEVEKVFFRISEI
jgi:hypothetical protein